MKGMRLISLILIIGLLIIFVWLMGVALWIVLVTCAWAFGAVATCVLTEILDRQDDKKAELDSDIVENVDEWNRIEVGERSIVIPADSILAPTTPARTCFKSGGDGRDQAR